MPMSASGTSAWTASRTAVRWDQQAWPYLVDVSWTAGPAGARRCSWTGASNGS